MQKDFEYQSAYSFLSRVLPIYQRLCNVATQTISKRPVSYARLANNMSIMLVVDNPLWSEKVPKVYEKSSGKSPYIPPEIMLHILKLLLKEKDYCTATCLGLADNAMYALLRAELPKNRSPHCFLCHNLPKPKPCKISLVHQANRKLSLEDIATIPHALDWQGPPLWYLIREFMGPNYGYCKKSAVFRKKNFRRKVLGSLGHLMGRREKHAPSCHYMVNAQVLVHRYKGTNVYCRGRWGVRDKFYVPGPPDTSS